MGHTPDIVWALTPKMMQAWQFLARRRRLRQMKEDLVVTALGSQGSERSIKTQMDDWSK